MILTPYDMTKFLAQGTHRILSQDPKNLGLSSGQMLLPQWGEGP